MHFIVLILIINSAYSQKNTPILLPNGWQLTPAGKQVELGDLPLNIVISSSGKWAAVTNNGQGKQSIQLVDINSEKVVCTQPIAKAWYGLKFSEDENYLYVSGGNDNRINKYLISNQKLKLTDSFQLGLKWPVKISPTGFDIDEKTNKLFVVTKENNTLYVIHLLNKNILDTIKLPAEAYTCLLSPNKKKLYITCWGCDQLLIYDILEKKITASISVGDNPNEVIQTKNGNYLFVANANDNSVSVIDTKKQIVIEILNTALFANSLPGSTTNSLALNANEKKLYIANADNNCLAVFDVSELGNSKSLGFIPTGWYPTSIKITHQKILVTNGKGLTSLANPYGPNPTQKKQNVSFQKSDSSKPISVQYIGSLFKGALSFISEPSQKQLRLYSNQVYLNTPYHKNFDDLLKFDQGNPVPNKTGDISPIKYIFYIIKENRTYDQVLGDITQGNGDKNLVLFGEKITPNQHKLANEFVLLDNFYCDGEVSADGHNWSLGAYSTDYLEKTWPTNYGNRGGEYDAEGNRSVANNKVFIWDQCKSKNISYRTYGEFADDNKANLPVLENHFCTTYTSWNQKVRDTTRYNQWAHEFDSLLLQNAVPQFNSLRFINDHTEGLAKGKPTPYAHVADNDFAVGLFVEHLSHSTIWQQSAVFIVEDDAQNGPDHVDAHRSTAYVAGGFVKSGYINHTPYSTASFLRTIELILGLQPMSQYDAAAQPLWLCFDAKETHLPFTSIKPNIDLTDKNVVVNKWQKKSETFNFKKEDLVPETEFNLVLWHGLKGNLPYPVPHRAAFLKQ